MSKFADANLKLNYFYNCKKEENFLTAQNGVVSGFYVVYPENIESITPSLRAYRINQFAETLKMLNEEINVRFYCLQQPFDFGYEQKRMQEIYSEAPNGSYLEKAAEVFYNQYSYLASTHSYLRRKVYVLVFSTQTNTKTIKTFIDINTTNFTRAGLNVVPAPDHIINSIFNEIFALDNNSKEPFTIENQNIYFKSNYFKITNHTDYDKPITEYEQIINVKQTSPNFTPLQMLWLSNLCDINDVFVSFDIDTLPEKKLNSLLESLKTDFVNFKQFKSQIKNERMNFIRGIINDLINDVAHGEQFIKLTTLLIKIRAKTRKDLRIKFEEVKKVLIQLGFEYADINFRQKEALEMLQPFRIGHMKGMGGIQKDIEMVMQTDAIAFGYPFTQVGLHQKDGNIIAKTSSGAPIIFNLCDPTPPNRNGVVLGFSGSRKTTLMKMIILSLLLNPKAYQTYVMDFENEYTALAENFDQQVINFNMSVDPKSPSLNLFQIPQVDTYNPLTKKFDKKPTDIALKQAFNAHAQHVQNILSIILSRNNDKLTANQISLLNSEIINLYKNFKISKTTNFNEIKNNKWPILDDFYNLIDKKIKTLKKKDELSQKEDYIRILKLLQPYVKEGIYDGVFNKYTNITIDENAKLVVFNIFELIGITTSIEISVAMLINVLNFWYSIMVAQRKRWPDEKDESAKYLTFIVDEFHKLVDDSIPEALKFLSQLFSQLRKYRAQILIGTQSISTFTQAQNEDIKRYLKQILDSSYYKFILGMGNQQLKDLNSTILYGGDSQLTPTECDFLATSSNADGGKMVMILGERERIAARIYSASTNSLPDHSFNVPFDEITEPIQLWQKHKE